MCFLRFVTDAILFLSRVLLVKMVTLVLLDPKGLLYVFTNIFLRMNGTFSQTHPQYIVSFNIGLSLNTLRHLCMNSFMSHPDTILKLRADIVPPLCSRVLKERKERAAPPGLMDSK